MQRMSPPNLARRPLLGAAAAAAASGLPLRAAEAATAVNGVVVGRDGWLFAQGDAMGTPDPLRIRSVVDLMKQTISVFRSVRIETVLSLTPARARVYRDMLPEGLRVTDTADRRLSTARQEFGALNVLAPDYYAAFTRQRAAQPGQPLFFKADTHWTSYGAELAAGEMARAIRAQFRLPAINRPGARLNPPSQATHVSDLAGALPVTERDRYPSQAFPTRGEEGGSLLDDDSSDTTVIGNSFMHPRYGFSRALSYALERPVALHWQVHGNGPYRTMLNYLGGDSFKSNRPALIVWNLHELDLETMPSRRDVWNQNAMTADAFLSDLRRAVGA